MLVSVATQRATRMSHRSSPSRSTCAKWCRPRPGHSRPESADCGDSEVAPDIRSGGSSRARDCGRRLRYAKVRIHSYNCGEVLH